MADAVTTRKCKNPECGEWYDARAGSCYICGTEASEPNDALKKAVETSNLNANLGRQVSSLQGEARAEQTFRSARNSGRPHDGSVPVHGYQQLVGQIRDALEHSGF